MGTGVHGRKNFYSVTEVIPASKSIEYSIAKTNKYTNNFFFAIQHHFSHLDLSRVKDSKQPLPESPNHSIRESRIRNTTLSKQESPRERAQCSRCASLSSRRTSFAFCSQFPKNSRQKHRAATLALRTTMQLHRTHPEHMETQRWCTWRQKFANQIEICASQAKKFENAVRVLDKFSLLLYTAIRDRL